MASCYELEVESEVYTSLWLTQKSFIKYAEPLMKKKGISEIKNILRKPRIIVLTSFDIDNFDFVVGAHNQWKMVSAKKVFQMTENVNRPKAIVVLLNPTRKHNNYQLSEKDMDLIDKLNDIHENEIRENVVFVVKASDSDCTDDTEELEKLSCELNSRISKNRGKNEIFKKMFWLKDDQIPVRIGVCLLDSLIRLVHKIQNKSLRFVQSMKDLKNNKNIHVQSFEKVISKSEICTRALQNSNQTNIRNLRHLLKNEIDRKDLLCIKFTNRKKLDQIIKTTLETYLKKRILHLKKDKRGAFKRCTPKELSSTLLKTRSMTKEILQVNCASTTRISAPKTNTTHTYSARCGDVLCWKDYNEIAKGVYADLFSFVTRFVINFNSEISAFLESISDEWFKRANSLLIHEWKTVTMRNVHVKGFGCIENNICVNLKTNDETGKKAVSAFLKKYLNDPPGKYKLRIEYKERKITLFSKLEQGSKINKKETEMQADGPRKYGSLGMFLKDNKGTYFFTTCAHVIGDEEHAYSPDDNSKLGRNVYINYSDCNKHDKNDPYIDFSLVQVSPERTLTCTFGLKTTGGEFINGRIFRGDLSEILNENVYKWGATEPCLRKGKCIGFEDEGSLLYLTVDTKDFAKGGDSGAIVCVGEDVETGLAAFVIVAGSTDESGSESLNSGSSYLVYKVSDALDRIGTRSGMTPCLNPYIRTISISSPVSDSKRAASKRKTSDKL
ncbi:uncharacterized protein [Mytilus edulis]|uniref:uncharacterized protein n=1 Tax=Mytilus edulis TaxID=6550 RepID=UPI0039F0E7F6